MHEDNKENRRPAVTATITPTPAGARYNRYPHESKRLRVCVRSLATLVAERKIPHLKIGKLVLFDPVAVDAALVKFQVGAPRPPKRRAGRIATPAKA